MDTAKTSPVKGSAIRSVEQSERRHAASHMPVGDVDGDAQSVSNALNQIAQEFRFTSSEVQEFYNKVNNVERTKSRFRKMRSLLTEMDDFDDYFDGEV